jgi:hypothetical protein
LPFPLLLFCLALKEGSLRVLELELSVVRDFETGGILI